MNAKETQNKAIKDLVTGMGQCSNQEDMSQYCQMIALLSLKLIHGFEGRKFKKAFIREAMKDDEMMNVQMLSTH